VKRFLQRFGSRVLGVLHGFDRMRFRGSKRQLAYSSGLAGWLSYADVLLKDFKLFARDTTMRLWDSIEAPAKEAGLFQYLNNSEQTKEKVALEMAGRTGRQEGLIAVLACVEPCQTMQVRGNRDTKKLELRSEPAKCKHYYHYYLDPNYGLRYTRLQSWFPFTMHIGLNGREWLGRQMTKAGIEFVQRDNSFSWIKDFAAAQELANEQLKTAWPELLDGWARESCPLLFGDLLKGSLPYYWSLQEGEYATDIVFRSAEELQRVYPRMVQYAQTVLHGTDVMRFMGYQVRRDGQPALSFADELITHVKELVEGTRVKHRVARDLLKFYDKFACILRLESLLLDVRRFKVYRGLEGQPDSPKKYLPLRQGVADIHRRAEICEKINDRYAEALANVEETTPLAELTKDLGRRQKWQGRSVRALNPLAPEDAALLEAISHGEDAINGFRNRDIRQRLYGDAPAAERKAQSAKVTRMLRMLRGHGLIAKVPKTHRYQLTDHGRRCVSALITARQANTQELLLAA
jgi:hypothetical protein